LTKRPTTRSLLIALIGAATIAAAAPAVAQRFPPPEPSPFIPGGRGQEGARPAQRASISLGQATAMAQSRYPGRVVKAESVMQGDHVIHVIRIIDKDGRVRTVRIDAQTGAFL
jgi:hypothetical protein